MHTILLILLSLVGASYADELQLPAPNGEVIRLNDFRGKYILIVNTASNSRYAEQYEKLEQLYQQYQERLVIIVVPSNSFGHEPDEEKTVIQRVRTTYGIHYLLASKASVKGTDQVPLYQWLATNGGGPTVVLPVKGDFQKYLLNGRGELIGIFAGEVDPLSENIQQAIQEK